VVRPVHFAADQVPALEAARLGDGLALRAVKGVSRGHSKAAKGLVGEDGPMVLCGSFSARHGEPCRAEPRRCEVSKTVYAG
jgi:hypothetical protein